MIRFQTLGSLDLCGDDRTNHPELVRQQKRVALLAYLAIEYAGRLCRRDTLLALFWPELDAANARNALSQALHFIRRSLGADAVSVRGKEEVGVNGARLQCDAVDFRRFASAGQYRDALAMYAGDLLPGFFVSGSPEFERWLETERGALKNLAASSAWNLSSEHRKRGELRDATREAPRWSARRWICFHMYRRRMTSFGRRHAISSRGTPRTTAAGSTAEEACRITRHVGCISSLGSARDSKTARRQCTTLMRSDVFR